MTATSLAAGLGDDDGLIVADGNAVGDSVWPNKFIAAKVTDYAYNPVGRIVIFLENGQVWQQLEGDTDRVHFKKGEVNTVVISRGMLGSYNLRVNDTGLAIKVRRLK